VEENVLKYGMTN